MKRRWWLLLLAGAVVVVSVALVVNHQRAHQAEEQRVQEMTCDMLYRFGTDDYYDCTGGSPEDDAPEPGQLDLIAVQGVGECAAENMKRNAERFARELTDDETSRVESYCEAVNG